MPTVKIQQRISGGTWRTLTGLTEFAVVQSYLSTARKWGIDSYDAFTRLFTIGRHPHSRTLLNSYGSSSTSDSSDDAEIQHKHHRLDTRLARAASDVPAGQNPDSVFRPNTSCGTANIVGGDDQGSDFLRN